MRLIYKLIITFLLFLSTSVAFAQGDVTGTIQCGDIVSGEIIAGQAKLIEKTRYSRNIEVNDYKLHVDAGTRINLAVRPLGETFNVAFVLVDSGGNDMYIKNDTPAGGMEGLTDFSLGSSNQILRIVGVRPDKIVKHDDSFVVMESMLFEDYLGGYGYAGHFYGAYEIKVGCTLSDGTVIEPGDKPLSSVGGGETTVPTFSGNGFPGLAPVDFTNAFTNELTLGQPAKSKIPPAGDAVLGYNFDAAANDNLALSFTRVSGNLNLGLVVLSADNKVVFQASLVTSSELTTKFTLPTAGTYTIGIFRIDLLPPDAPEATAFQLTATLNP